MTKYLSIVFSIPRTLWFNLRYLPFFKAIKLPIWIANNVKIRNMHKNGIILTNNKIHIGLIRIGYHKVDAIDTYSLHTIIDIRPTACIIFNGDAHIGHGAILSVQSGTLTLGKNFSISGNTCIICNKYIEIGENVQFSWNSLVMDNDAHYILDVDGTEPSNSEPVIIGNNVWIAAETTILKGTQVPDKCVIGAKSLLNKKYNEPMSLIAGSPAKSIKKIGGWHL